jgi:hypothetical protein
MFSLVGHRSHWAPGQVDIMSFFILFALVFFSSCFYFVKSTSRSHNYLSYHGSCPSHWSDATWPREGRTRWSRCNRTIRFVKPECPIYPVPSMSFQLLFISCGNRGSFICFCYGSLEQVCMPLIWFWWHKKQLTHGIFSSLPQCHHQTQTLTTSSCFKFAPAAINNLKSEKMYNQN